MGYELNDKYLNDGIKFWLNKKSRWPRDFHNGLYKYLAELRSNGLTPQWWETIIDVLWQWVAIRPKTKQFIRERGKVRLDKLNQSYQGMIYKCNGQIPSNVLLEWKDVEPLFATAFEIKEVSSPVFASKLCHFIAPGVFPVIDQEVLGGSKSYKEYWKFCRGLWNTTNKTEKLVQILSKEIGINIIPEYPWTTKIVELSLIGQQTQ